MATLHELAVKLQEYIVDQQTDAHNVSSLNLNKYNNMKLIMDGAINYPHVIVQIGISEVMFNLKDMVKVDGGLGSDEKYVRTWLGKSTIKYDLTEIYNSFEKDKKIDGKSSGTKTKKEGVADDYASRNAETAHSINKLKAEIRAMLQARYKERQKKKTK